MNDDYNGGLPGTRGIPAPPYSPPPPDRDGFVQGPASPALAILDRLHRVYGDFCLCDNGKHSPLEFFYPHYDQSALGLDSTALAEELALRSRTWPKLLAALEREVEWLDRPFGMHTYNKGGIHEGDCAACAQRERLRAAIREAREGAAS